MPNNKSFREFITEAASPDGKTVVLTFGRMNPPHAGHEKVIVTLEKMARKYKTNDMRVYLSHSVNPKKDPIPYRDKIRLLKKMFPKHSRAFSESKARTLLEVLSEISEKEKDVGNIVVVVGSDRVAEFRTLLNKYNSRDYEFADITVESAGERDPDAEGVTGMSASKMRDAAQKNDFEQFRSGLPRSVNEKLAREVFDATRRGMNLLNEEIVARRIRTLKEFTEQRERYVRNEIFNLNDLAEDTQTGKTFKIVYRGPTFVRDEEGNSYFIHHLKEAKGEYQGRTVTLNKPMKGDVKKSKVYVKNDKGNVVKVEFGDPDMAIKKHIPERRKSFRARHKCDEKKDKTTPGYWSCKAW
jgi:hypothetical protein